MRSLRKLSAITFLGTFILLAMLIITGYSQNRMMSDYSSIVKESERTIFFYSTIREQTTMGLLSKNPTQLLAAAREVEQLQGRYTDMLDNSLIPSQYKLSFLQNIDLEQIVIDLKLMAESGTDIELALKIQDQLRSINNQFLQFDRIVITEMKHRVMYFQKRALILMGFIISLISFTLLILYKKSVKPLISLAEQSSSSLLNRSPLTLDKLRNSSVEVKTIIASFNQLLAEKQGPSTNPAIASQREAELSGIVNEVTNRLNGIINYSQLLADYCEAENMGGEQKEILHKIISNGEKSAIILQQSLHRGEP